MRKKGDDEGDLGVKQLRNGVMRATPRYGNIEKFARARWMIGAHAQSKQIAAIKRGMQPCARCCTASVVLFQALDSDAAPGGWRCDDVQDDDGLESRGSADGA